VIVYRHVGGRINDYVILQVSSLGLLRPVGDVLIVHHTGECGSVIPMHYNDSMLTGGWERLWGDDVQE
jgi:hypothetical protein